MSFYDAIFIAAPASSNPATDSRRRIKTVFQLSQKDKARAQRLFSVGMVKTIEELNGCVRFVADDVPVAKKQLMCSRSFAERITRYGPLRETNCEFAARAAERLRGEGQVCSVVSVFIRTSMFNSSDPCYSNTATARLSTPSADTRTILSAATDLLDSIWKDGLSILESRSDAG